MHEKSALIVVDPQKDFCEGGALEVKGADEIMPLINNLLPKFPVRIGTQDWHPEDHISFKSPEQGGAGCPKHCVAGTKGAEFHPKLKSELFTTIIRKGTDVNKDTYSAFKGTGLAGLLKELKIEKVYICGLALDYCVKATALDAVKAGFSVEVLRVATRAVDEKNKENVLDELKNAGVICRFHWHTS